MNKNVFHVAFLKKGDEEEEEKFATLTYGITLINTH